LIISFWCHYDDFRIIISFDAADISLISFSLSLFFHYFTCYWQRYSLHYAIISILHYFADYWLLITPFCFRYIIILLSLMITPLTLIAICHYFISLLIYATLHYYYFIDSRHWLRHYLMLILLILRHWLLIIDYIIIDYDWYWHYWYIIDYWLIIFAIIIIIILLYIIFIFTLFSLLLTHIDIDIAIYYITLFSDIIITFHIDINIYILLLAIVWIIIIILFFIVTLRHIDIIITTHIITPFIDIIAIIDYYYYWLYAISWLRWLFISPTYAIMILFSPLRHWFHWLLIFRHYWAIIDDCHYFQIRHYYIFIIL
jgi:hypothetical protein